MSGLRRYARTAGLALFVLLTTGIFVFSGMAAQAATTVRTATGSSVNCDATINDMTTGQVVTDSNAVTQAATTLDSHGDTLHVVVYDGSANGSSAQYAQTLIGQCPQWTLNDPTQIAPNVILVVMDLQHHITIRDGSDYSGKLDSHLPSIVSNAASTYNNGEYATALTSLLNGIDGTLYPGFNMDIVWIGIVVVIVLILAGLNGASTRSSGDGFWYGFLFANYVGNGNSGSSGYTGGGGSFGGGSSGGGGFSGSI